MRITNAGFNRISVHLTAIARNRRLGRSFYAGHDRGARVAWRLAVEHPDRVTRVTVLDMVPLLYSVVTREFATQYVHWFFLIQPATFAETLIGGNAEFYLRSRFLRPTGGAGAITPVFAEYLRCFDDPAAIHATCEDYRAVATRLKACVTLEKDEWDKLSAVLPAAYRNFFYGCEEIAPMFMIPAG